MAPEKISVRCCIAGGGPAGMMLGYLLARGGQSLGAGKARRFPARFSRRYILRRWK
jgi:NADPH-dependent 2,4-dienoyl-CoA reductase/sulfur reductase-like enzyme